MKTIAKREAISMDNTTPKSICRIKRNAAFNKRTTIFHSILPN